jgi:hypothetical protein
MSYDKTSVTAMSQSMLVNTTESSKPPLNKTLSTSMLKESSMRYDLTSIYPTMSLNETATSLNVSLSLPLEGTTSTMQRSSQINDSYQTSEASKTNLTSILGENSTTYLLTSASLNVHSSFPLEETTSTMQISSQLKDSYKGTTSMHRSTSSPIETSSEMTIPREPKTTPDISNSKTVTPHEGKRNSAGTKISIILIVIFLTQFMFLLIV